MKKETEKSGAVRKVPPGPESQAVSPLGSERRPSRGGGGSALPLTENVPRQSLESRELVLRAEGGDKGAR